MSTTRRRSITVLLLASLVMTTACQKQEDAKPPEQITQVTVDTAKTRDLPIAEFAAGAETALGSALDYDPAKAAGGTIYVRLTFPEHVGAQLHIGQPARLTSFGDESRAVQGEIRDIRPALSATTLSREVIVAVRNSGGWRPQGSIRGEVTLGVRRNAVVVPEHAAVLRPAGTVVYVVEGDIARERRVKTGLARDGMIEIAEGLQAGATIAVDGASLLSEGAKISVRETATVEGRKSP